MKLYIDADAFPNMLKPMLIRIVERFEISTYVIANKRVFIGDSDKITYLVVSAGADEADNKIVEMLEEGDLVITADIPLADRVIAKNGYAMDHKGDLFREDNIKNFLAMRNLMQELRESGEITGGPKPFNKKNVHEFANQLNNFLVKHHK
ncbi:MAG: YaiI/YqxD family protein [Kiritimatiellae bacterium]|jgi:uncharacterized protein YaiI (UPF0178 family)|nr:YaiI/YqxD family protein [Kiritimatiellia bacterium]